MNSKDTAKSLDDFEYVKEKSIRCEVQCPFCGDQEFDMEGLEYHLKHDYCEVFDKTEYLDWKVR